MALCNYQSLILAAIPFLTINILIPQLATSQEAFKPDITVAADGTGDYRTISEAVRAATNHSTKPFVIFVKRGKYIEHLQVGKEKTNIHLIGEGMGVTVISGSRSNHTGYRTSDTATVDVKGEKFFARDLTISKAVGKEMNQAVALQSRSEKSVFYRVEIVGYQDTLYAHSKVQFYRECKITGTVDFIFGNAAAVFQKCTIQTRQSLIDKQTNTITAHGRDNGNERTGFVFHLCTISEESDLKAAATYDEPISRGAAVKTYLGRPWREYAVTVFMECYMSEIVDPIGWLEWNKTFDSTVLYGEYRNVGPGAVLTDRVKWRGFHAINNSDVARQFTISEFLHGDTWIPAFGVPYQGGLTTSEIQ
ncbi:hypothetical protein MLD38_014721 [Melastoma candidum]|uniref:Uncharacterized protein n=1 Tax=Melastoma candidum TaxID=119954 RepID=A0ACB9RDL1_9MYRT|nr:hypothetical protein MLD38_014721 [Melastoma candidum]